MADAKFNLPAFNLYDNRTVLRQFDCYQADGTTELVVDAADVFRFKVWKTADTVDIDASSIAMLTAAFTANAGTDELTAAAHGLADGNVVLLTTTGTLPDPLALLTPYYVRDATTNTFKLAATKTGAAIDLTDAGTGTHTFTQTGSRITVDNVGVPSTTPAQVTVRFDQVDTEPLTPGTYRGELSVVDDSDEDKIKPICRMPIVLVGSASGNIALANP